MEIQSEWGGHKISDDILSIILPAIGIVTGLYAIIGSAVTYKFAGKNRNRIKKYVILTETVGLLAVILGVIALLT